MRRTGKTFRTLLGSLKIASEGKHVIYECTNTDMARWTFDRAIAIVADFMEPDKPERLTLKIGTGTVRFTGPLTPHQRWAITNSKTTYEFVFDN